MISPAIFWSVYVAGLTLARHHRLRCSCCGSPPARRSPPRADNTTGHVWDEDLTEMNNPLPRWWVWLFVLTIVFSLAYLVLYPGPGQPSPGRTEAGPRAEYEEEVAKANKELEPLYAQFAGQDAGGAGGRRQGHGHRRAPVHEQLRAVPRLRRTRQQGLPEPDRRRLAARRRRRRSARPSPRAASARCRRWPPPSARRTT